ncbi:MAG: hypothetical protein U0164_14700 [Gemmatimonadaceae bacterium]
MSRAPLPSLRSLFASGGGPLALVRKDEALAERLVRIARDDIPAIVEQGARAAQVLTEVPNIGQFLSSLDVHANESSDAKHDERGSSPRRPPSRTTQHDDERARGRTAPSRHDAERWPSREKRSAMLSPDFVEAIKAAVSPSKERVKQQDAKDADRIAKIVREVQAAIAASRVTVGKAPAVRRKPDVIGAARSVASEVAKSAAGVARILSQFDKGSSPSRKAKEGERQATRDQATRRGDAREAVASIDAMMTLVRRLEHRGSKEYDARRHKVLETRQGASEEYVRERRGAAGGGASSHGAASSRGAERSGARPGSAHGAEQHSVPMPAMSEAIAPTGGFRGLAQWAAEQSGDADLSTAIERNDGVRAPMLQQLHASRRGWTLSGDELALSLDGAARNEGLDLDEVAS